MASSTPHDSTLFPGVALVIGAAGTGIGSAIARSFAQEGCRRIFITDLSTGIKEIEESIKHGQPEVDIRSSAGDISDPTFVRQCFKEAIDHFGRIDYLVNAAGFRSNKQATTELSIEDFDKINNLFYRGVFLCNQTALGYMLEQQPLPSHSSNRPPQRGSIVNIASQLGIVGRADSPAYCAAKAAVIALTRSDAIAYSKHNIRVNCICPGLIDTPMTKTNDKQALQPYIDIAPMKRMGLPEEIADAVIFLSSTKASFVQGSAMVVDGGYIIN